MKLAEFAALCDREWSKPKRGDVVTLRLTPASHAELTADALAGSVACWPPLVSDRAAVGAKINTLVNPVTRTVVKMLPPKESQRETARVKVMGGTYRSTWWPASA